MVGRVLDGDSRLKGLFTDFTWGPKHRLYLRNTVFFKRFSIFLVQVAAKIDSMEVGPKSMKNDIKQLHHRKLHCELTAEGNFFGVII